MNLGKGLAFAAIGAFIGAVIWIVLVNVTGRSLWFLAPIVGGAAGFGMMRATQMKGGAPAGALAAMVSIAAVFSARYFIVTQEVQKILVVTEDDVNSRLQSQVAEKMEIAGMDVYDDDGGYNSKVQRDAQQVWYDMAEYERAQYIAAIEGEHKQAAGFLTPLGLIFDFGIFGTVCTALAAGTAFKTGSVKLEQALVEKGMAVSAEDATGLAAKMRAEDTAKRSGEKPSRGKPDEIPSEPRATSGGIWAVPMQKADDKPIKMVKVVFSEDPKPENPQHPGQQAA